MNEGLKLLLGIVADWIVLLLVIPLAERLGDFGLPEKWPAKLLALVAAARVIPAAAVYGAILAGGQADGSAAYWIGYLGPVVFWVSLWKVFELDLFGAIIISIISWVIGIYLSGLILAVIASL
jgi:hypothetical protein